MESVKSVTGKIRIVFLIADLPRLHVHYLSADDHFSHFACNGFQRDRISLKISAVNHIRIGIPAESSPVVAVLVFPASGFLFLFFFCIFFSLLFFQAFLLSLFPLRLRPASRASEHFHFLADLIAAFLRYLLSPVSAN